MAPHYIEALIGSLPTALIFGGYLLKNSKVAQRAKDRLNVLWRDRCIARGEEYVPVEDLKR